MSDAEKVSNPTGEVPGGSPLIAVADFPKMWDCLTLENYDFRKREHLSHEEVAKELNVDAEIAKELADVCSVDTLHSSVTGENNKKLNCHDTIEKGILPEAGAQLQTLRSRVAAFAKYGRSGPPSQKTYNHYKYKNDSTSSITQPVVLLTVTMTVSNKVPIHSRMVKHDRELLVHANTPLCALKDKLLCPMDLVYLCGECSENPDTADDTRAHDLYKSSFIFIEDTFYSDMRDPKARDITGPLRRWITQGKSVIVSGEMKQAKMEETTFNDLSIRLGYPYLYVHQGDCEHNITFTDIRFMDENDHQDLDQYPLLCNQSAFYRNTCIGCKTLTAKWMTKEDALAPADPCFFCDVCYYKFHYDTKGNKLGNFKAYRHIDPSIFR
nr:snRNA-activating protein complex subunit 3-like [Lytechinus pictus]